MLGLHHHPPARVEQAGRGVAALLDVRRVGRADEHRAHLLADRPQAAGEQRELDRIGHRARSSATSRARRSARASPGGPARSSRAARSGPARRPVAPRRLRRRRDRRSSSAPAERGGEPDRHQLELAVGVVEPVALAVLGFERRAQSARAAPEPGDRQLERLPAVAQLVGRERGLGLGAPAGAGLRAQVAGVTATSGVGQFVAAQHHRALERPAGRGDDQPERSQHPAVAGRGCGRSPAAAISHACRARRRRTPAARARRGSIPRSTVTTRSALTISALATRDDPLGARRDSDIPSCSASRRPPARRARDRARRRRPADAEIRPSTRLASVTVGSVPPRP